MNRKIREKIQNKERRYDRMVDFSRQNNFREATKPHQDG